VSGVIQVLPFIAGGILLVAGREDGLYWVAAGSIAVFIFSGAECVGAAGRNPAVGAKLAPEPKNFRLNLPSHSPMEPNATKNVGALIDPREPRASQE
jgi:hypothetical protein